MRDDICRSVSLQGGTFAASETRSSHRPFAVRFPASADERRMQATTPCPNRLSLMISYYDTRFVLFCSTPPHESARCPDVPLPTRRVSAEAQRLSLLPPSAGLLGAPVVPRQICFLRKNSVIEIIRSPSLLFLCVCFIPISGCACRWGCCDSPSVGAGLLSPRRFCGSPGCSIRCGPRHRRR